MKMAGIGNWASTAIKEAPHLLFGNPGRMFVEGKNVLRPGGLLSNENIWWPSTAGLKAQHKIMPWLQRAGTVAIPFQLMSAARDPNDGALANTLGTAGALAGTMYGMPAFGVMGSSVISNAAARAGRGIGHAMGSKPLPPAQQDSYYP
jgi:hypothetical protein